ncbi:hypothetical protein ISN44_As11g029580 [Arabidopsis suecica]|uniref:Uncharacterized protein n=1 Tax=Arabidopsis suecica TaxID=45249 RepID=A0A8T1ZCP7_ARASU|nr:hypothetical protein ISN44_As11g029580 [Arabidopsis suecica]
MDGPSTEEAAVAEKRTKSREDKGKGVGGKRSASGAGMTKEGPPTKTFCLTRDDPDHPDRFSFRYVGNQHLSEDKEAAFRLWSSMLLTGAMAHPDPDELTFSEAYKKFARSSLGLQYEEVMKKAAATHQAKVALLNVEVARLGRREIELMEEVSKLQGDLVVATDHEEKELARLRDDRLAKVTRTTAKAQSLLNKVKSYIKEQADVVQPKTDALNQSKGAHETVAVLIGRGVVIAESKLENLAREAKVAEDEVDALEVIELEDADLNMYPDQLSFGRVSPSAQIAPVTDQHGSNSELVNQSDIRDATVEEENAEA